MSTKNIVEPFLMDGGDPEDDDNTEELNKPTKVENGQNLFCTDECGKDDKECSPDCTYPKWPTGKESWTKAEKRQRIGFI